METREAVKLTGEQTRQLRKARGWTVQRLAAETGLSSRMIGDFERGARQPHPVNLDRIMAALVVPGVPEATRSTWPEDIGLFLDVLGAFLAALPEGDRGEEMRLIFTDIGIRRAHHP